MKKIIVFLFGALILLGGSCAKISNGADAESVNATPREIMFSFGDNSIAPVSKSIITGTSFPSGEIGVFGFVKETENVTDGGYLMKNAKYDAVTGNACDGKHYYWPKADNNDEVNVKFVAYYPFKDVSGESLLDPSGNLSFDIVAGNEDDGEDILYAVANNVHPQDAAVDHSRVSLTFHHALALLQFRAKKDENVDYIKINSVKFNSELHTAGTFSLNTQNNDVETSVITSTSSSDLVDFEFAKINLENGVKGGTPAALNDNDYHVITNQVIVPQDVPTIVTINYDLIITNDNISIEYKNRQVSKEVLLHNDANGKAYNSEWVGGHAYIYRIYIKPDDIDFTISVDNWTGNSDWWQIWDSDSNPSSGTLDVF